MVGGGSESVIDRAAMSDHHCALSAAPEIPRAWLERDLRSGVYNRRDGPRVSKPQKENGPARRKAYSAEIIHGRLTAEDGEESLLLDLVRVGSYSAVKMMLRERASLASIPISRVTGDHALHVAAACGFTRSVFVVCYHLQTNHRIYTIDHSHGPPPSIIPLTSRILKLLLKVAPDDADAVNKEGVTALHMAVINGECECAKLLVEGECCLSSTKERE